MLCAWYLRHCLWIITNWRWQTYINEGSNIVWIDVNKLVCNNVGPTGMEWRRTWAMTCQRGIVFKLLRDSLFILLYSYPSSVWKAPKVSLAPLRKAHWKLILTMCHFPMTLYCLCITHYCRMYQILSTCTSTCRFPEVLLDYHLQF